MSIVEIARYGRESSVLHLISLSSVPVGPGFNVEDPDDNDFLLNEWSRIYDQDE